MLLGGLALQVKYTVLPQCLLFGLAALWRLNRLGADGGSLLRHGAIFAALGLAPNLLVTTGYAFAGQIDTFWYANFQSIFARGALTGLASAEFIQWIGYGSSWLVALVLIALVLVLSGRRRAGPGFMR